MKTVLVTVAIFALTLLLGSMAFAAAFQNGSFETVVAGSGQTGGEIYYAYDVTPTGITGWNVAGPDGAASDAPAGVFRAHSTNWQSAAGDFSLGLAWMFSGSVSQTFDTVAGQLYTVDFQLAGQPSFDQINHLDFYGPGVTTQFTFDSTGKTEANMGRVARSVQFTATSSSSTIMFSSWDGILQNYFSGPVIDNVSVAQVPLPTIYYYDVTYASGLAAGPRYDNYHTVVCIQGLANREAPRVFIKYWPYGNGGGDAEWLARLREPGGLCEGWPVHTVANIGELVDTFRSYINGVVLYDADAVNGVRSTSLVATTVAGVEGGIAVRKDTSAGSMYNYLVNTKGLPVILDLTDKFTGQLGTYIWQTSTLSTGSRKCDAYMWAKEKYIYTGKCDPTVLSYTLDLWGLKIGADHYTQLSNLDYAVSKKAFCFELSPWGDEAPNDDPNQPLGTDRNTFIAILDACNVQNNYAKMIKFCGFPNWSTKYSNFCSLPNYPCVGGSHTPLETEAAMSFMFAYNAYIEPDWYQNPIANASYYSGLAPAVAGRRYVQNPPPAYSDMVSRGLISGSGNVPAGNYVLIGHGDYDSPSWTLYPLANDKYNDANRSQIYSNWGVDPQLTDRTSVAMDYMYRHKTAKDYFIAWDSGAGNLDPTMLYGSRSPSGYPSIIPAWQEHSKKYYRMFDYSISAWLLNQVGTVETTTDLQNYASFSGDGIGTDQRTNFSNPMLYSNIPTCRVNAYLDSPSTPITNNASGVSFAWYRTVLWSPTDVQTLQNNYVSSGHNHQFLDAYTFYYLMRYYLGGNNNYRATWVSDTIPRIMANGATYPVTVTVRNDGWDAWSEASLYRLGHAIVAPGAVPTFTDYDSCGRAYMPVSTSVAPGQSVTFSFNIAAPSTNGNYDLYYDMVREGVTWFRSQNNLEWKKDIIVATNQTDVDTDGDGVPDVTEEANGTLYWNPDDNQGTIRGTIRSSGGTPLVGASVSTDTGGYQATTAGDGTYSLIGVQVGTYNVTASKSGYYSQTGHGVAVLAGQTTACNLSLTPLPGGITGTIRDSYGNPLAGAAVSTNTGGYSTTSLTGGTYTLSGVSSGTYDITASKSGYYSQTIRGVWAISNQTTTCNLYLAPVIVSVTQISDAKALADGEWVAITDEKAVTCGSSTFTDGRSYIEEPDRASGIKLVLRSGVAGISLGERITLTGIMRTDTNGERYIEVASIDSRVAGQVPGALGISTGSALKTSSAWDLLSGLLVKVGGQVGYKGPDYMYMSEGEREDRAGGGPDI